MKDEYIEMLKNNDLNSLANIDFTCDLLCEYEGKTLLEYLLKNNIHSLKMDDMVQYNKDFINMYLKFNIIKPLLNCSLSVLLTKDNDELLLDRLLKVIDNKDKMELYDNLRVKDYNLYRINENTIIESFKKSGIIIPRIFIGQEDADKEYYIREEDRNLIYRLKDAFSDQSTETLRFYLNELKKRLLIKHDRTVLDIEKLIEYKINNPSFHLTVSNSTEGFYIKDESHLETSRSSSIIFDHELSHLLFQIFENNDVISKYERIREKLDNEENFEKITEYLKIFHQKYKDKMHEYEKEYYELINNKYGNFDNYLLYLCKDFYKNKEKIKVFMLNELAFFPSYYENLDDFKDIVLEFLEVEKKEYITKKVRNTLGAYLMLENLLDAIMVGKICDNPDVECLSGHSILYFMDNYTRSFDEILANFDAICKASDKDELIRDLETLVGSELIKFLENYIEINRENQYGNR